MTNFGTDIKITKDIFKIGKTRNKFESKKNVLFAMSLKSAVKNVTNRYHLSSFFSSSSTLAQLFFIRKLSIFPFFS